MQQQKHKQTKSQGRRSLAEIVISWLVLLWGGILTIYLVPHCQYGLKNPEMIDYATIFVFALTLHSVFCLVAGIAAQFRFRFLAGGFLSISALSLCALIVWMRLWARTKLFFDPTIKTIIVISILTFFLGYWLGKQRDIEE